MQNTNLVICIGSSVCCGSYADDNQGWAWMLGQHLTPKGMIFKNLAVSGSDTRETMYQLKKAALLKPKIVIIGLSIANEGLNVKLFLSGMSLLISEIKKMDAVPIVGNVYPNNYYGVEEYKLLLNTNNELKKWKEENKFHSLLDFLSTTDDGYGHWLPGTFSDASHPNSNGHKLMFDSIDLTIFDEFCSSSKF